MRRSDFHLRPCAVVVTLAALVLCMDGCALRATTDFGPQSEHATRTISAGPEGLPGGLSGTSGPNGDAIGVRHGDGDPPDGTDPAARY